MMKYKIFKAIQGSAFFQGISEDTCRELAELCSVKEVRKKDILFTEESRGNAIFLLDSGAIQLQKTTPDGNDTVIRTVKPGEIFAEVILFEQDRYPVTATAIRPSTVYSFSRKDILALLKHEKFRNDFIRVLMQKMRYLTERVGYLTSYDVEQRFFMFLRDHYGEQRSITVDISKKDLAAAIGTTPETFSRLVKRLADEGAIHWLNKTISVPRKTWALYQ